MTEVTFYHLTETTVDEALPGLVEKALARGWRVTVQADGDTARDDIDALLWSHDQTAFLPHGRDGDEPAADHPIYVTTTPANPNASQMRFVINRCSQPDDMQAYARVAMMFDGGNGDTVHHARENWKQLNSEGHDLTYWKQNAEGRWERAA
ncbi:MAG: DNA polymerase III subunit chi [Pseudomonadota bacterium]